VIRLWLVFAILAILIHLGVTAWRKMDGRERWTLTKSLTYSILVSLLAVLVMMLLVVLF